MAMDDIDTVKSYEDLISKFQETAAQAKDAAIEPSLAESDFGDLIQQVETAGARGAVEESQQAHYAAVETVFRKKFYELLVGIPTS